MDQAQTPYPQLGRSIGYPLINQGGVVPSNASAALLPITLEGDFGVCGIGRSLNEAFGCQCLCVSNSSVVAITRSNFFDVHHIPSGVSDTDLLATLLAVAQANRDQELVLMADHDLRSSFIARNFDALIRVYALPFSFQETTDQLANKAGFARAYAQLGIDTPRGVETDFAHYDENWRPPEIPFALPVIAKTTKGESHDRLHLEGKRKIQFIGSAEQLEELWEMLARAGFDNVFPVQELIPRDSTAMRSITAYVDSHGEVTLIGSARVPLEDHAPTMIGNPVAMVTEDFPTLWDAAERLLTSSGYRNSANSDVKIDPRDGRAVFSEINPRIGRSNWYMGAAGLNPMTVVVADLVRHRQVELRGISREILCSVVPDSLPLKYIRGDSLRAHVKGLIRSGPHFNPLLNPVKRGLRQNLTIRLQKLNHHRKLARYYPEATDWSF